jgi:hypothetical protein
MATSPCIGNETMLKTTLIAALFALAGLSVQAQTNAAVSGTAKVAAPAASAPAAKAAPAAAPAASAAKTEAEPEVKKSNAGICHDKTSPGYKQTKNFSAFKTMEECVKSGGRAPKK